MGSGIVPDSQFHSFTTMIKNPRRLILLAAAMMTPLHAAPPTIDGVSQKMKQFIEAKEIAGSVTLVANENEILHLSADGMADIGEQKPMKQDAVFWIASMSKPVTATAVLMMHEQGLLSVDDPVAKYLPEFRNLKDAQGNEVTITIRQCLIHSSGLSDLKPDEVKGLTTLAQLSPIIAAKPVNFAPGSKWAYCQTGINTAARIVEVVSGETFPEFLQTRLFTPLGMKDTSFYPGEEQTARLATSYTRTAAGELEKAALPFPEGKPPTAANRFPAANGGLFSTAADYLKFARMILRGGELDGKRYLKEESVKLMTSVQSGDLATGFTPGGAWGLGWSVSREPQGPSAALSPGSFGHGGAYGTQVWIDPVKNRIFLLLVQRANFANSDGSEVRAGFQNAAVAKP